ncbi:hypothetical protein KGP36_03275 [Patescibacteria group bacterium]|nr:hypothetical protein [Patescibacteria group bacterium]
MAFMHGKFREPRAEGEKSMPGKSPKDHEMEHGKSMAPHGGSEEKHVTETHPGETQPHPVTGVHAFHAHHMGSGKFKSHTHHDGGEVETRHHPNEADLHQAHKDAFPDEFGDDDGTSQGEGSDFSDSLSGVGGMMGDGE